MSGLIWVQTVCKGYQQMTLVGKELMHLLYFSDGENNFFTAASINLQLSLFKGNF